MGVTLRGQGRLGRGGGGGAAHLLCLPACLPWLALPHGSPTFSVWPLKPEVYGFSSERKMASVLVKRRGVLRLYNKGAAEMVLTRCVAMHDATGASVPMTEVRCAAAARLLLPLLPPPLLLKPVQLLASLCCRRGWRRVCRCRARCCVLRRSALTLPPPSPLLPTPACLPQPLREELLDTVTAMASTGLRTLCLAYTDFPEADASR